MSELNVYHHELRHNEYAEFYLKSEADKVIARLRTEHHKERDEYINMVNSREQTIKKLEAKLGAVNELVKESKELLKESQRLHKRCADNAIKKIRHSDYKRCLAIASKCRLRARWFGDNAFYKKEQWTLKWHRRWLELAEKFREAK